MRLTNQHSEREERNQTILGSFGLLQPSEDFISTTPSAPPLPCGETSGITSTSVQGPTRTLGSDIDRRSNLRTHRYFSATSSQRSSDRSGNLGTDYRILQTRKRRSVSNISSNGPRTRLGSVVGGYSATRFPSSTNRICPPSTRRTTWRSLSQDAPVGGSHGNDSLVFNQSLSRIMHGNQNPSQTISSQYQVQGTGRTVRGPSRDVAQQDTQGHSTPATAVQSTQTAGRHMVSAGGEDLEGIAGRNNHLGLGGESLPSHQSLTINVLSNAQQSEMIPDVDNARSSMIQERVEKFGKNEVPKESVENSLKSMPVAHDDSMRQFARDVHGASIRLRNLELEVER